MSSSSRSETISNFNLTSLATELQLEIVEKLPYRDKAILRATNSYFRKIIPPFTHDDLLAAEREEYATSKKLLTCKYCVRLRHESAFGDGMRRGRRGRNGTRRCDRFCIDCGIRKSIYHVGTFLEVQGKRLDFCGKCRRLKRDMERLSRQCRDCYQRNEKKWQEWQEINAQNIIELKLRREKIDSSAASVTQQPTDGAADISVRAINAMWRRRPVRTLEQDISSRLGSD